MKPCECGHIYTYHNEKGCGGTVEFKGVAVRNYKPCGCTHYRAKTDEVRTSRERAWKDLGINEWRLKLRSTTDQKKAAELLDAMYDLGFEKARELEGLRHTNLGEVTYTKCRRCGAKREDGKFEICCM